MSGPESYLLRKAPYGDADYMLTLFTREFGKVSGLAKNAKTSSKRFGGRLEPFVLFRTRFSDKPGSIRLVEDAETVRVFRRLMEDIELFLWGSFALETVDALIPKESPNEDMFELLTALFTRLDSGESVLPAMLVFQMHAITLAGYEPNMETCTECGKPVGDRIHFSIRRGGALCGECGSVAENGPLISRDFLGNGDLMEIQLGKVLNYIKLFSRFTEYHTEKKLNSSKFIEELKL